jgi:hypothetical protein
MSRKTRKIFRDSRIHYNVCLVLSQAKIFHCNGRAYSQLVTAYQNSEASITLSTCTIIQDKVSQIARVTF